MILDSIILSVRQLADARTFRLLLIVTFATTAIFAGLGIGLWQVLHVWLIGRLGGWFGPTEVAFAALLLTVLLAWFLFRAVAMAVMGLLVDSIIESVEEDHYPDIAARAVPVGFVTGLRMGLRSALRAVGWNMLALPAYLALLVTGVGTAVLMVAVNALILGRDLEIMAAARHPTLGPRPLPDARRRWLGLIAALAFVVPLVNFVAPVFAAALAVHMLHRPTRNSA